MSLKIHKKHKGYLVVHAAELLVGISLLGMVAFHGLNWWEDSKRDTFYQSLKDLETVVWEYRESNGRWPGDCNNNQVIEGLVVRVGDSVQTQNSNMGLDLDYSSCSADAGSENFSHLVSELRLFKPDTLFGKFGSKLEYTDDTPFQIGALLIDEGVNETNVIIADGISTDLAKWLELKIDGISDAQDSNNFGRTRFWKNAEGDVTFVYLIDSLIN